MQSSFTKRITFVEQLLRPLTRPCLTFEELIDLGQFSYFFLVRFCTAT
jgi:hypothetical protein